jgi:hypothetical protein
MPGCFRQLQAKELNLAVHRGEWLLSPAPPAR